tara:strand:+ start:74 stop:1039 length:966 start_codon:yes stop_codon:yes gene_type:complete
MDDLINEKYKPKIIDEFYINNNNKKNLIKFFLKKQNLKLLIIGNICSGKTTFINLLINEYFEFDNELKKNNLLYISSLKDNGINFFRNDIKIFCQSNKLSSKKKLIVIDDLENINDQCQYILLGLINNFKSKINIIISVNNYQKILDGFLSHLYIVKLEYPDYNFLLKYTNNIIEKENINIDSNLINKIIINSNYSIKNILNILEKFILYENKITNENIDNFLYFISDNVFYLFTSYCIDNNKEMAIIEITNIYNSGYSLIDIYELYSNYIKNTQDFSNNIKFKVIEVLISFIIKYYDINENIIDLYFFINCLINSLNIII